MYITAKRERGRLYAGFERRRLKCRRTSPNLSGGEWNITGLSLNIAGSKQVFETPLTHYSLKLKLTAQNLGVDKPPCRWPKHTPITMVATNVKSETMALIIDRLCGPGGPSLSGNLVDSEVSFFFIFQFLIFWNCELWVIICTQREREREAILERGKNKEKGKKR